MPEESAELPKPVQKEVDMPGKEIQPIEGVTPIEQAQVNRAVKQASQRTVEPGAPGWQEWYERHKIEGGAPFFNVTPDELSKLPQKLRTVIELIERRYSTPSMFTKAFLEKRYEDIEQALLNQEVRDADAAFFMIKIAEEVQRMDGAEKRDRVAEEPQMERVEFPEDKEGHLVVFLDVLDKLEQRATQEVKRFEDYSEYGSLQRAVKRLISEKPTGQKRTNVECKLDDYLKEIHPEGVGFKEKLLLVLEARRRLSNRTREIVRSGGDMALMGAQFEKLALAEGVVVDITDIRPIDLFVLVYHDELFQTETSSVESKEIHIPVAEAMKQWQTVGEAWREKIGGAPSLEEALKDSQDMRRLRTVIATKVGSRKAEEIAYNIFMVMMCFERWNPKRETVIGWKGDVNDLMYLEEKRIKDYYERMSSAGPAITIGKYFARLGQGEVLKILKDENGKIIKDPDYEEYGPQPGNEERVKRLETLKRNREDKDAPPVFMASKKDIPRGQLVGDVFETQTEEREYKYKESNGQEKKKKIKIPISDLARKYDWKAPDYLALSDGFYHSYFDFGLVMVGAVAQAITKSGWDIEKDGLTDPNKLGDIRKKITLGVGIFSPWINWTDRTYKENHINKIFMYVCLGILYDLSYLSQPERGKLDYFLRSGRATQGQVNRFYAALRTAGLPDDYLRHLQHLAREFNFAFRGSSGRR